MTLALRELLRNGGDGISRHGDDKDGRTTSSLELALNTRISYNKELDSQGTWRYSSHTMGLLNQEVRE